MTGWLKLTDEQRKTSIDQAAFISGRQASAIEKDWWVTLTLKVLFAMPEAKYLVFKGGTSLSKRWKLIQRFSEDIDIALSPEAFGMQHEENPGSGYLSRLKKKGCKYTSTVLKTALENQFAKMGLGAGVVLVESAEVKKEMPDTDPQTLFVKYNSLYDKNPYIDESVKIEVGVRSLKEPHITMPVQSSMLYEIFPNAAYTETSFDVVVMEPQKTFLEKLFLLHEEFLKTAAGRELRTERMSRHLYDIEKLMDTEFGNKALLNQELYDSVIAHREKYSRYNWMDYSTLGKKTISFLPPEEIYEKYKNDYAEMKEHMFFRDSEILEYDNLINRLKELLERVRKS